MTKNKFDGELCAYCGVNPSVTGDHIFARGFFINDAANTRRANLPQAPTCNHCNNVEKGQLENELMNVLGFGGRHADAADNLDIQVAHRLSNKANARTARELQTGTAAVWVVENGVLRRAISVPVDWAKVEQLFCYIARGLAWHHFDKLRFGTDISVSVASLIGRDAEVFRHVLNLNANCRVDEDVGEGTFHYRGAQSAENPQVTAWEFTIYGGIRTASSGDAPYNVYVMTVPRSASDRV